MRAWRAVGAAVVAVLLLAAGAGAQDFSLNDAMSFPFISDLTGARAADRIAWVRIVRGVRNVWVADGPGFVPRQVTRFAEDDGQELTQVTLSPDGSILVFVRGGDHDANWPAKGGLQPDPDVEPGRAEGDALDGGSHRRQACRSAGGGAMLQPYPQGARLPTSGTVRHGPSSWTARTRGACSSTTATTGTSPGRPTAAGSPSYPAATTTRSSASTPLRASRSRGWLLRPVTTSRPPGRRTGRASPSCACPATVARRSRC